MIYTKQTIARPSKVPTAPPENVRAEPEDSSSVRVMWSPPPVDKQNGHISHYKLYYVEATRPDKEAIEMMLKSPLQDGTEFKLEELKKWTQYRIWLLAGTVVGDGPPSESITVRTQEDGTYLLLHLLLLLFFHFRPSPFAPCSASNIIMSCRQINNRKRMDLFNDFYIIFPSCLSLFIYNLSSPSFLDLISTRALELRTFY
jgi:hypothetical protein